jgi:hypothetical protein
LESELSEVTDPTVVVLFEEDRRHALRVPLRAQGLGARDRLQSCLPGTRTDTTVSAIPIANSASTTFVIVRIRPRRRW